MHADRIRQIVGLRRRASPQGRRDDRRATTHHPSISVAKPSLRKIAKEPRPFFYRGENAGPLTAQQGQPFVQRLTLGGECVRLRRFAILWRGTQRRKRILDTLQRLIDGFDTRARCGDDGTDVVLEG